MKCPFCIHDAKYVRLHNSCLFKIDGVSKLKRGHNYYHQTQQQLFTLNERRHNDFVVYTVDQKGNAHLLLERILPDESRICFCRTICDGEIFVCSNEECPYGRFHTSCLFPGDVTIPKNGTTLTALDYHSLRDIPGRNLSSRSKPNLMN